MRQRKCIQTITIPQKILRKSHIPCVREWYNFLIPSFLI